MQVTGRPTCLLYGDRYSHASGYFERVGSTWVEYPPYGGTNHFEFEEVRRDREYIYLRNLTPRRTDDRSTPDGVLAAERTMLLRLPACGGVAQWSYQNPLHWTDLAQVWK